MVASSCTKSTTKRDKIAPRISHLLKRFLLLICQDNTKILITRAELDQKTTYITELKTRVEELKLENEYQLRLKDMNFGERIKQVTEKFQQELDALKITSNILKIEKEKEEMRHHEESNEERDRHSRSMNVNYFKF